MRVCHIIHSLQRGGAEHLLVDLSRLAPGAGLQLAVVSLMPLGNEPYARELEELGVPLTSLNLTSRWDPRALLAGLRVVRRLAPDVVHTHLKHADIVGSFAARRAGIPLVSTLHLIEDTPGRVGRVKGELATRARMKVARTTITVSDSQRRWYLENFGADPTRVVTVRNGVSTPAPISEQRRSQLRAELGVRPESIMVTMVSVMRPGKGHAELIAAADGIGPSADVTFVLAGDGPLRRELEGVASRRAGGSAVLFAGFREDVGDLLQASDLVVQPSLRDALPTALIHALAAGRPVVASKVGGIPEIVTPAAGVLVPPSDPGALAAAVERLSLDGKARADLGRGARLRFEEEFDAAIWIGRLRRVYQDAVDAGG